MSALKRLSRFDTVMKTVVRRGHHDVPANPGPPITLDYMPIPSQSYQKVHDELQSKFNKMLGVSLTLLLFSFGLAGYTNIFHSECNGPPDSYRNRKNSA